MLSPLDSFSSFTSLQLNKIFFTDFQLVLSIFSTCWSFLQTVLSNLACTSQTSAGISFSTWNQIHLHIAQLQQCLSTIPLSMRSGHFIYFHQKGNVPAVVLIRYQASQHLFDRLYDFVRASPPKKNIEMVWNSSQ